MVDVCMYFQVHQPYRLKKYTVFEIGKNPDYFDDEKNKEIMKKVARKCYLPTNNLILKLINETKGNFRVAYSITGTALEQFEKYSPEVLDSFKELAKTGCVEFLSETYYHSLSFLYSKAEFTEQVNKHKISIQKFFGQTPKVFRNTELIYNNELANFIEQMGYIGIIAEGADHILDWKSPNFIYKPTTAEKIKLLLKNYKLSDDIAFRFSNKGWNEWPLSTKKFGDWIRQADGQVVNLFMDYETFGEHQWEDTGIFNFLNHLPHELLGSGISFKTPTEICKNNDVRGELDIHNAISWADMERDLSAWLGNKMQHNTINELYKIEEKVKMTQNPDLIDKWKKLQTSDHFYYMCTKWFSDGDVHKYFNPYDSPYDSFIAFMNILNDLNIRINTTLSKQKKEVVIDAH
ncbi:polysaccharide deacetylase family protein [archaeon]|jgi:alpha-amylase|nr:polysaccharide deacetylase family protein [archaeon]MBT4648581.1 polysaccharide deacetylase family protein [archaeon]MBT6821416.1 polysaccharide deacetylase family protein [archaeon]MBT7393011.1 polysaccharide deacetylase family protein [archaeon]